MARPQKLSAKQVGRLKRILTITRKTAEGITASELRRRAGLSQVSARTILRYMHRVGFVCRRRIPKPGRSPRDARERLQWAQKVRRMHLKKVAAFVDYSHFRIPLKQNGLSPRHRRVWLRSAALFSERLKRWATRITPGLAPQVSLGGAFGAQIPTLLLRLLLGGVNGATAAKFFAAFPRRARGGLVQVDGDPAHRTDAVRRVWKSRRFRILQVPARSGDVAPMETVWSLIKRDLAEAVSRSPKWRAGVNPTVGNVKAWGAFVLKVAKGTARKRKSTWLRLRESFPKRVGALVRSRGGPIRY
jgi:hypothetical protein